MVRPARDDRCNRANVSYFDEGNSTSEHLPIDYWRITRYLNSTAGTVSVQPNGHLARCWPGTRYGDRSRLVARCVQHQRVVRPPGLPGGYA